MLLGLRGVLRSVMKAKSKKSDGDEKPSTEGNKDKENDRMLGEREIPTGLVETPEAGGAMSIVAIEGDYEVCEVMSANVDKKWIKKFS